MKTIYIDEFHRCFDGHFDDKKIFPAVAQISLCKDLLESEIAGKKAVLKAAKFMRPISPGMSICLHHRSKGEDSILVEVKTDLYLYSRIKFVLLTRHSNSAS